MPPARSSASHRRPESSLTGLAALAAGIRWDRVGRVALLIALAGVLLLYIGPAHSWVSTWHESHRQAAIVHRLEGEHTRLVAERKSLQNPLTLEREARALGMVRPTERSYVVTGLPKR